MTLPASAPVDFAVRSRRVVTPEGERAGAVLVRGERIVAVVGDGAMTCGLPYEALNNAGDSGRNIIVVLNDNGMSIAPNVGALNKYLGSIVAAPITVRIRERSST